MQRTGALIERLQQQYKQSVSNEELAVTVQFLLAELQNNSQVSEQRNYVSVIMPEVQPVIYNEISSNIPDDFVPQIKQPEMKAEEKPVKEEFKPSQPAVEQKPVDEKAKPVTPVDEEKTLEEETKPVKTVAEEKSVEEAQSNKPVVEEKQILLFSEDDIDDEELQDINEEKEEEPEETITFARKEPPEEKVSEPEPVNVVTPPKKENTIYSIPTFALKQQELNEKNAASSQSLHDKYKSTNNESPVRNEPIKDLRKAIGINDRYRFINELFRNDETMYERSIKTINTFSVLSEAEYWISRELKLKIGWSEESETVKDFDQLIRRRFS